MENRKTQACVPADLKDKLRWMKAVLRDSKLNATAKNIALALLYCHDRKTGRCNPSREHLAEAVGGMYPQNVSPAISALKAGGWISTVRTRGVSYYVLHVERIAAEAPAEESAEPDGRSLPEQTAGVCDTRRQESAGADTEPSIDPSIGAIHPNRAMAADPIRLETQHPVAAAAVPQQPPAVLPVPANDDDPRSDVEEIAGLKIPGVMYREWEATFRHFDLRPAILSRARWAKGIREKFDGHRLQSLQTELGKMNEAVRADQMARQETKAANAAAGIKQCDITGMIRDPSRPKNKFQI